MSSPKRFTLLRNITAAELAVDDPLFDREGGGYPPDYVIGSKGSTVQLYEGSFESESPDSLTFVNDFANDPFVSGYVWTRDLEPIVEA